MGVQEHNVKKMHLVKHDNQAIKDTSHVQCTTGILVQAKEN